MIKKNLKIKYQTGLANLIVVIILVAVAFLGILTLVKSTASEHKKNTVDITAQDFALHTKEDAKQELRFFCQNKKDIIEKLASTGSWETEVRQTNVLTNQQLAVPYKAVYSKTSNPSIIKMQVISNTKIGSSTNTQMVYSVGSTIKKSESIATFVAYNDIIIKGGNFIIGNDTNLHSLVAGGINDTSGANSIQINGGNWTTYGTDEYGNQLESSKGCPGQDQISGDAGIRSNKNTNEFFSYVFGGAKLQAQSLANHTFNQGVGKSQYSELETYAAQGGIIWVNGNLDLSGQNGPLGSEEKPVFIIATGTVDLNGQSTIYGVVYGDQGISFGGGTRIFGSLVSGGDITVNGNKDAVYDSEYGSVIDVFSDSKLGCFIVPGSWIDYK